MCHRDRRPEVKVENGLVRVAVKDYRDAPVGVVAVADGDCTVRDLTGRALNAGESASDVGKERSAASSTLGLRLLGGGLVLGGKGEHNWHNSFALLVRLSLFAHFGLERHRMPDTPRESEHRS